MHGKLRLRDFFDGRKAPPPEESALDVEELMAETEVTEELDVEDAARQCQRSQARVWERIDGTMRDERRHRESDW